MLYSLGYGLSWSVCHRHLKRMCVLLLFGDIIYKGRVYPVGWWCWVLYPWWFSVWLFCLLMEEFKISSCYCEFVSSFNSISVPSHSWQFFGLRCTHLELLCLLGGLTLLSLCKCSSHYHYIIFHIFAYCVLPVFQSSFFYSFFSV